MADSVIVNKSASIERCLRRIREDYFGHEEDFETDFMRQDAILLNLQRACEQSIGSSNHLVRIYRLGAPQGAEDTFDLLQKAGIITPDLCRKLTHMVGFRNIAVHEYSKLNLNVVRAIIEKHLDDFSEFVSIALRHA
ncbi:MAG: DUF86 domain-containing protein [Saprospiraceae bacterium]|nr:DUF86 domain-containing protein [Saprospiraceae bacterium]MDW8228904.1 DUF86 domain-containing protein [Saprospiraceae bacterium]